MQANASTLKLAVRHAHGNHFHIGQFTVSRREANGLSNPAVWTALGRKDLAHADGPIGTGLTAEALA
jgi:hypothetical protein